MTEQITLGSLFDGIGGWPLAALHAGIRPVWSSEIEKFPQAVTKTRFPDMVQLGDITQIDGAKIEPVDIICMGSPCQDLSVAGRREGLKGARSGLFHQAIELIRRMRTTTGGRYPRFIVWENVPGAFSSNRGLDFKIVLEEIAKTEIPIPGSGKWAPAGMVRSELCDIAWRVLDAQYWGVPQRRKRIFLVADFGTIGRCAAQILFERKSLSGNITPGGKTGKGLPPGVGSGTYSTVAGFSVVASAADNNPVLDDLAPTMRTTTRLGCMCAGFKASQGSKAQGIGYQEEMAPTLSAMDSGNKPAVLLYENHGTDTRVKGPLDKSPTIAARAGTGGNNLPLLLQETVYSVGNGQVNQVNLCSKAGALNCMHDQQCVMVRAVDCRNLRETETCGTLQAKEVGGYSLNFQNPVRTEAIVRRLTPLECERLQGLPDGWTLIDDKSCSDSARYKAIGNGMAQPCADFIIRRIAEAMREVQA